MKEFLFFIITLNFGLSVNLPTGRYDFNGKGNYERVTHLYVLNSKVSSEMKKIRELQAQGYRCELKVNLRYTCKKRVYIEPPRSVYQQIIKRFQDSYIEISSPTSSSEIYNSGADFEKWYVYQPISSNVEDRRTSQDWFYYISLLDHPDNLYVAGKNRGVLEVKVIDEEKIIFSKPEFHSVRQEDDSVMDYNITIEFSRTE